MSTEPEFPESSVSKFNSLLQIHDQSQSVEENEEEYTECTADENRVPAECEFNKPSELPESSQSVCNSPVRIHRSSKGEEIISPVCVRTPKSDENRIPVSVNCPKAPEKPKNRVILCKRKLLDASQFFENQDRGCDQIESFFESMETDKSRSRIRKRLMRL